MTDLEIQSLKSRLAAMAPKVIQVELKYVDGTTETINGTPPEPPTPANVIRVGPTRAAKSLDDVNLNTPNKTYWIDRGATIRLNNKQAINVAGVVIQSAPGAGAQAILDVAGAAWKEELYSFNDSAVDCGFRDISIMGHDGGVLAGIHNAQRFFLDRVNQIESPYKGGVQLATTYGVRGMKVTDCTSTRTGRYTIYVGSANQNADIEIRRCRFGPSMLVEVKDNHVNMGFISEHCFRCYTVKNLIIDACNFDNSTNIDGKQAMKVMSGDGVTITNSNFKGSTRFGRDVNDPAGNTLKNVNISKCTFTDWFRVDPGATVTLSDSSVAARSSGNCLDMHDDGKLTVKNVTLTYPGGKWSANPKNITNQGGCTFNGAAVA